MSGLLRSISRHVADLRWQWIALLGIGCQVATLSPVALANFAASESPRTDDSDWPPLERFEPTERNLSDEPADEPEVAREPRRLTDSQAGDAAEEVLAPLPTDEILTLPPQTRASEELPEPPGPAIEAAALEGIRPGSTQREELHEKWGRPQTVEKAQPSECETFQLPRLGTVRVTIEHNIVQSLSLRLERPMASSLLAKRLAIDDVEPVDVFDAHGQTLGQAYPERGVLLAFAPASNPPKVFQVFVEQIDAEAFLARAEVRLHDRWSECLADIRAALAIDPQSARAHAIYAELARRAGELDMAMTEAQKAVELDPNEAEFRLQRAKVLATKGDHRKALRMARELAESNRTSELVSARAHYEWGNALAAGDESDYAEALKLHTRAIALAQPLAASPNQTLRRAAKELLVDAHLAVAHDIGWGRWQQKSTSVAKWLERADGLAEDIVLHEQGADELRLRVCEGALAALVGITEPTDCAAWLRKLTELGDDELTSAGDSTYRAHIAWRLALGLAAGVEIESTRKHLDAALALGETALEYFSQGHAAGEQLPNSELARGRLYYRLGAIWAIERRDHKRALNWYEQAVPLLEGPAATSGSADLARCGETLVSIGVSFWETDHQAEALRLTEQGVALIEQAVVDGQLNKTALSIPYGNLASMHDSLGHSRQAKQYTERAARWEQPVEK